MNAELKSSDHLVPNVLANNLQIVFCGTAPSRSSATQRAYYAHPQNRFWKTLKEIGLTPNQFQPQDFQRLLEFSIGLTDLCKITCGNDDELPRGALDVLSLRENITIYQPKILAFTSKRAGQALCGRQIGYGWQQIMIGSTRISVLPSTSPRARAFWNIKPWLELVEALQEQKDGALTV
jgi:TDG/mug DNA glycosylase family protein